MTSPHGDRTADGDPMARFCTATAKSTGRRCTHLAMRGQEVCRFHGGRAPQARRAAARRVAQAEALERAAEEVARLGGGSVDVDPLQGLLDLYEGAMWNVAVLTVAISGLLPAVDRHRGIAIPEQVIEFEKGGTHVPASVHVLVGMYDSERDRAAKYAKLCLDAGVEERRVRVAEGDATRLGQAFARALDAADAAGHLTAEGRSFLAGELGQQLRALVAG